MKQSEIHRFFRPLAVTSVVAIVLSACTLVARRYGIDPIVGFEVASAISVGAWMSLLAWNLWRGHRLSKAIWPQTVAARVQGIECRVVMGPGRPAFVLGARHPTIYVGESLLNGLEEHELRAILLHEEYHRRTYGPLRAASLEAWISLASPIARVTKALADRLVDLERAADRYALGHGATAAGIASALVKVEAAEVGSRVAFTSAADRRVGGLLELTGGMERTPEHLPYEWLPPAMTVFTLGLCHVLG
ncbi:MAG: hypothetical protein ABIQ17_06740 [Candidatus Limnocylindrales bacterium]